MSSSSFFTDKSITIMLNCYNFDGKGSKPYTKHLSTASTHSLKILSNLFTKGPLECYTTPSQTHTVNSLTIPELFF